MADRLALPPNCGNCFHWCDATGHTHCRHRVMVHAVHFGRLPGYQRRAADDLCPSHPAFRPHRLEEGMYYPDNRVEVANG